MKYFAVVLLFISISPLLGQTKVWEATSPTAIDYLTISHDGSTLASLYQGSLYVWRSNSSSYVKLITISYNSPPIISKNNDTVYCLGIINSVHGIYAIPLYDDTVYFRPLKELPNNLNGGLFTVNPTFRFLKPSQDSLSLIYGYSYTVITSTSATYSRGRVGILSIDGVQTKELIGEVVEQISTNISTNYVIASGKSQNAPQRSAPYINPYTKAISLQSNKTVFSSPSIYSGISVCHDTNYIVLDHSLYHLPTGDYVRNLTTPETGNYHSCSDNFDFYITVKGDSIFVIRYDSDIPILKIQCAGNVLGCQLSADSRRIVVLTNSKLLTVYNVPEVSQSRLHADFTSDYTSPYKGGSIQFRSNSYITDSKYRLLWEFGDGNTSSALHPKYVYSIPGTYSVRLTIITSSGDTNTMVKTNYISYEGVSKPLGSLWANKYTNAGITALTFFKDSIFVGTNDGCIFSTNTEGNLGKFIVNNTSVQYALTGLKTELLHYKAFTINDVSDELYAIGVPKGISAYSFLLKIKIGKNEKNSMISIGNPWYYWYYSNHNYFSEFPDGGNVSIDINLATSCLHLSNYGSAYGAHNDVLYPFTYRSETVSGCNAITYLLSKDTILYDNGLSPDYDGKLPAFNPNFIIGSDTLNRSKTYSIRTGLPFNPNSYFVIAKNNVHHIRYGTFDLIAKFPTKGTILRHSPDQYHSFTNDGVWSFADGKRLDSLPLLTARSFEVFPDGVHLLVIYPKSDTVAIFNTRTKQYVQYFKANFIVSSIAISKDGKSFATGDTGGIVTLWQTPKLNITKKIEFISPRADKSHIKGDTVLFYNTSIPVNSGCRYEWDFGDGTSSQDIMPKHIYEKAGRYTVGLRAHCPPESGVDSTVDHLEKLEYITVTDSATSVEIGEVIPQEHLAITPNPLTNHGVINVNFPHTEHFSVRISTLLGQEIMIATDVQSAHEQYSIPILPSGVYSCQLRLWNGEIISRPFIISK